MRPKGRAFVQAKHPTAQSERHRTNGGEVYWLIRMRGERMYFASGDTESKAWRAAAAQVEADEAPEKAKVQP